MEQVLSASPANRDFAVVSHFGELILALRITEDWYDVNILRTGNDFPRQMSPYGQVQLLYSVSE